MKEDKDFCLFILTKDERSAQINTDFSKNPLHSFSVIKSTLLIIHFHSFGCFNNRPRCIIDGREVLLTPKSLN